jgi:hydroxymethylpyrimidine/phosphomethylpyrimidine kinase
VALLLKDGHGHEPVVRDRLYLPEGGVRVFEHPRVDSRNTHGTGCTLSAAIAARLAWGEGLEAAVEGAIAWLAGLIARSAGPGLGGGHGPLLHHLAPATR